MKQPKLSVTNKQFTEKFEKLLDIPEGEVASKTIIGAIGDPRVSSTGKSTMVPVVLIQKRTDLTSSSKKVTAADKFFRGWKEWDNLVRHTENVTLDILKSQNFQEGMIIEEANLAVDVGFKPFYTKNDGTKQEPIKNPETDQIVTSEGQPLYRQTRVEFGPAIHTGLNIPRDVVKTEEVKASVSLDDDDYEDNF